MDKSNSDVFDTTLDVFLGGLVHLKAASVFYTHPPPSPAFHAGGGVYIFMYHDTDFKSEFDSQLDTQKRQNSCE